MVAAVRWVVVSLIVADDSGLIDRPEGPYSEDGKTNSFVPRKAGRRRRLTNEAHYEGQEIGIISGLTSKEDVNDWLNGPRKIEWLQYQGYAK